MKTNPDSAAQLNGRVQRKSSCHISAYVMSDVDIDFLASIDLSFAAQPRFDAGGGGGKVSPSSTLNVVD
jgi:hypothetical protein